MKHRVPNVLYFSLSPSHIDEFWTWVEDKKSRYYKNSIFLEAKCEEEFSHTADLSLYINHYEGDLQWLYVIIDIGSIVDFDQKGYLRNTIVEFPEVKFLFDKHYKPDCDVIDFLFAADEFSRIIRRFDENEKNTVKKTWDDIKSKIDSSLFEVYLNKPNSEIVPSVLFSRIINGFDNMFDASNLRYAIKYFKYLDLKVHHHRNFKKIQDSRFYNLAICIEEESRQNIFNCYALYANGYRAFPIKTRQELELLNKTSFRLPCSQEKKCEDACFVEDGVIIRDFDLQFEDEDEEPVDAIRGYRYCEKSDLNEDAAFWKKKGKKAIRYYHSGWNDLTKTYEGKENPYWGRLVSSGLPLFFITKGPNHSKVVHPQDQKSVSFSEDNNTMYIPGFPKPVCGLYRSFQEIPTISTIYTKSRYVVNDEDYELKTGRKDHDHSTPLDLYDMANSMIQRAESYYEEKRYILAAVVSGEALEFLNGFHHRLMIKAYYIQAIAENAIAMDVVGSNEHDLAKDASCRVEKIVEDVDRFYYGHKEISKRNILSQIFSACRQFCKEHDHFESEEVFIKAMGHLWEGVTIPRAVTRIVKLVFKRGK